MAEYRNVSVNDVFSVLFFRTKSRPSKPSGDADDFTTDSDEIPFYYNTHSWQHYKPTDRPFYQEVILSFIIYEHYRIILYNIIYVFIFYTQLYVVRLYIKTRTACGEPTTRFCRIPKCIKCKIY